MIFESFDAFEKLKFHHSDAPDAEGRFRKLSPKKLAKWLVRTRKRDMRKITGSINQQVNFNKRKDPEYARKMEKTREEVKKLLDINEGIGTDYFMMEFLDYTFNRRVTELEFEDLFQGSLRAIERGLVKFTGAFFRFQDTSQELKNSLQNNVKLINVNDYKKVAKTELWRAVVERGYDFKARKEQLFDKRIFKLTPQGKEFMKSETVANGIEKFKQARDLGLTESARPFEIKSEKYWRTILAGNEYALKVLDTVIKRQGSFATARQMEVLNRARRGDKSPYHTKN
jgi:hypothetical protein